MSNKINNSTKKYNRNSIYAVPVTYVKPFKNSLVYGQMSKDVPFVYKNVKDQKSGKQKRIAIKNQGLPIAAQTRVMAFYDNPVNSKKRDVALVYQPVWDAFNSRGRDGSSERQPKKHRSLSFSGYGTGMKTFKSSKPISRKKKLPW